MSNFFIKLNVIDVSDFEETEGFNPLLDFIKNKFMYKKSYKLQRGELRDKKRKQKKSKLKYKGF
jgi:hypothetical protein